jgi:hypothetical protein
MSNKDIKELHKKLRRIVKNNETIILKLNELNDDKNIEIVVPSLIIQPVALPEKIPNPPEALYSGPFFYLIGLTEKTLQISYDLSYTVATIKTLISIYTGVPEYQQRLIINGSQRDTKYDDKTLADNGVKSGDTLTLVLRLRGG